LAMLFRGEIRGKEPASWCGDWGPTAADMTMIGGRLAGKLGRV